MNDFIFVPFTMIGMATTVVLIVLSLSKIEDFICQVKGYKD